MDLDAVGLTEPRLPVEPASDEGSESEGMSDLVIQVAGGQKGRGGRTFALVFRHLDVRVENLFLFF